MRQQRLPRLIACVIFAITLSYYCFGPNLGSWFGLIDDHETLNYLGPDHSLSVAEMPGFLMQTEVGHPFAARRFRPVYYSLRLVETALWRDNVTLWYGVRMLAFAGFVALAAYYFVKYFGWGTGGALALSTLTAPYWADIFGRLGPPENYTVPAMGLVAFGLAGVLGNGHTAGEGRTLRWLALLIGGALAIGVKENYLFVLPLLLWAVFVLWQAKRGRLTSLAIAILLLCGITVFIFLLANFVGGTDFYGDDTSLKGRVKLLILYFRYYRPAFNYVVAAGCIVLANIALGAYIWWHEAKPLTTAQKHTGLSGALKFAQKLLPTSSEWQLLWASMICLGLSAVQYLFHKGLWPHGTSRYDFPGLIFLALAVACWLKVLLGLFSQSSLRVARGASILIPILVLLATVPLAITSAQQVRQLSLNTLARTTDLKANIDRIAAFSAQNPSTPIVIVANDPLDFEAADSIAIFFNFQSISSPKTLAIGFAVPFKSDDTTTNTLAKRLQERSAKGDSVYLPFAKLDLSKGCASFALSGVGHAGCIDLSAK